MTPTQDSRQQAPARIRARRWLERHLAKSAEVALLVLLASGLVLFGPLGFVWSMTRWALLAHVAAAVVLVPVIVLPFWGAHRHRLGRSSRRFHRLSGRLLEGVLALLFLTGTWLAFIGWNGTTLGASMHWVHLVLGLPVIVVVVAHAWRYSALRNILAVTSVLFLVAAATAPTPLVSRPDTPPAPAALKNRPQFAAAKGAVESRSLLLEPGGKTLLSANFDGGSVTRVDRETGKRLAETALGGDIHAIAADRHDGIAVATDYVGNRISFLNLSDLSLRRHLAIPGRPAGVVYDARNRLFWVAATEGGTLYGVTPKGRVLLHVTTARAPRGLALLPDGRLLVSHYTTGALSIYDTTKLPPKREKLIHLAVEQNPDEFVSQGLPRGLDRIAVSPDLKQAWLPHMLWNFDHPFQFQSTVYPAVSVISLKPGDEHEVASRRKQLFKQINILEDGNRTRIVSNPADAAFSEDGKKVYVTMAGSEDLVVFDLSRALPIDSKSRKAKTTEGAAAVQIYRHLPGQEPRGLVVTGDDIYVQNAQGLDLTRATTGGKGPFARVKVTAPHFARLVANDPLDPALRRGKRLFDLANTSEFPDAPMAGDNWMSCSSCHLDGFNFTNRALFQATPVKKFDSAFTGHGSIEKLVAGDFIGDYIRMVQNTQGGMGADTRFGTPKTDPDTPSPTVAAMMKDLHLYVTSPGNLPLLATWLRGKDDGASVAPDAWTNSAVCASCHSDATREWSGSMHHFMGQSDPYYVVIAERAAKDVGEPFRAWCMGCHEPQAVLSGLTTTPASGPLFRDGKAIDPGMKKLEAELRRHEATVDEGTGCLLCHAVTKVEDSGGARGANASFSVSPGERPLYPFETSDSGVMRALSHRLIRALPDEHATSLMRNITGQGAVGLCSTCHEEFAPGTGAYINDTYRQWAASPYNAPDDPAKNRTCLDCHMHASVDSIGRDVPGRSTDGGPVKANVVSHTFVGAQYHLIGLRDAKAGAEAVALLKRAATLSLHFKAPGTLIVRTSNTGAGHDLPTGVADFRQVWLQVRVTDATGKVVLRSGDLDANGHLDPDARLFQKAFDDKGAHAVALKFWRIARFTKDTDIPAGGHRDEGFVLPEGTVYPVRAEVRLKFRTFPQWITDAVVERFPAMPQPKPVDMAETSATLGPD